MNSHRIRVTSLGDHLLTAADEYADKDLLVFPDRRATYGEMAAAAYRRARSLRALGVERGDHVGILMANSIEYIELVFGIVFLGAIAVPMNARYKASELAYVVENADLKVIVTSDAIADHADFGVLLRDALPGLAGADVGALELSLADAPLLEHLIMLGADTPPGFMSEGQFDVLAERVTEDAVDGARVGVSMSDPAIMMYTSGTTADPKGCPLKHESLVRNGINMNRERYFMSPTDRFWAPLPMFHMAAVLPLVACIDAGAALLSMVHVDAGVSLDMFENERVTVAFPSFPTITNDLINHPTFKDRDLSALRRINNVAPIEVLRQFQSAFPQAVQTGAYGLTEAGGVVSFNHPEEDLETRLTTCGRPFSGLEVKIAHMDTGDAMSVGERGECWLRGYAVFDGYYKSPEKNAEAFVDGWLRTGDLCSVNEAGAISFHGRIKDMLKVGGENVAAVEIESVLAKHPAVNLAQVIGVPDARLLEVACAYIETHTGQTVTEAELIAFCKEQLASFKVPRHVRFVEEWPMSSTKVQKFRLQEWFAADVSATANNVQQS